MIDEMRSDEYLTNTSHTQTKFIYSKFFSGKNTNEREQRLKLLNISIGLPGLISETFADFVGEPESTLDIEISDFVEAYSWGGYTVFEASVEDGEFKVEYVNPDSYVKNDDGSEQVLTILLHHDGQTTKRYIFEKIYRPGTIENNLYKADSLYSFDGVINDPTNNFVVKGDKVDLTELAATAEIPPIEQTKLDYNPIVVVHNSKLKGRKYGTGDVARIRSMVSSIEVGLVNLQDQLLKHLQAKMHVPKSAAVRDKNGFVQLDKMEVIMMESGDPLPGYMMNTNPLIDKEFDLLETLIRSISARLAMPIEFFGLDGQGGAESAETRKMRLARFEKRIKKARARLEKGMRRLYQVGVDWGVLDGSEEFEIVWPSIFPVDKAKELDELSLAVESKLMSQEKAIMRYQGVEEDELEDELAKINGANAVISADQLPV